VQRTQNCAYSRLSLACVLCKLQSVVWVRTMTLFLEPLCQSGDSDDSWALERDGARKRADARVTLIQSLLAIALLWVSAMWIRRLRAASRVVMHLHFISLFNVLLAHLTNFTEQSPSWEAYSRSAGQEISRLIRNHKVHCRVRKSPPPVPVINQINLFPKIHLIFLSNSPRFSEWSLPFRLSTRNCVRISHLPHACYMPRPSHPPYFDPLNG
jgi:hypothetical protein